MKNIEITSKKDFMARFLTSEDFDCFLVKEALIKTANTISIDGREHKEFYSNDKDLADSLSPYEYAGWDRMKTIVLSLIRGQHTPLMMKITLYLKPELAEEILKDNIKDVEYLVLNFYQNEQSMNLTTSVAYKTFTLDKEAEAIWDSQVMDIIKFQG